MEVGSHSIQHADFSVTEGGPLTQKEAIELLHDSLWEKELAKCSPQDAAGQEWCPPNFTMYADDDSYLQICFLPDGKLIYIYSYKKWWSEFLPLGERRTQERTKNSRDEVEQVLRYFYEGKGRLLK